MVNALALALGACATALGLALLGWILWLTLRQGLAALDWRLFTQISADGEQGDDRGLHGRRGG